MIDIPDITIPITFVVNGNEHRIWPVEGQILADARNKAIASDRSESFLEWEMRDEQGISLSPAATADKYSGTYIYVTPRIGSQG